MKKILYLTCILCGFSFAIQVFVSNHFLTNTTKVDTLLTRSKTLQDEISILDRKIYGTSSVSYIEEKAGNMGFIKLETEVKKIPAPSLASAL